MTEKGKKEETHNNFSEEERELLKKIKTVQSLPDEVVSEFLKSKGTLSSTNFKIKILSDEK